MKAKYWQNGVSLDYKNTTEKVIEANTVVVIGSRIGVIGETIAPGELGALVTEGVFEMSKEGTAEIAMGTTLYYSEAGITTTEASNPVAGYAAAPSADGTATVLVKIG